MDSVPIGGSKGAPPWGSKFFHFQAVFGKKIVKQECIPVGCVPSAAVAVCWGVSVWGKGMPWGEVSA